MTEKTSSPLNNPPQEKSTVIITGGKTPKYPSGDVGGRRDKGVWQGGKERIKPAEAIVKCPHCGREIKVVFAAGRPPEWVRCTWCGELQPADGYRVIAYGSGLPRPLAPHEVQDRAAYLESLR